MLIDRARETNWETLETLVESEEGALVAALSSGRQILLFIPRSPERGRLEAERAAYLRGPGIPVIQPLGDGSWEALLLAGAETSRPLRSAPPLPDTVWRAALRRLVSALSHAHGKGFVHGRITRDAILADPSGEFWIHGWADARPAVGRSPFHVGLDDVASDLRALGGALVQHLGSSDEADPAAVQRAVSRLATSDAELARVLGRLVATDPRESYETATEVLTDLGEPDESMHDPLAQLRFVGRRRLVRKILAQVERAGTRHAQFVAFEVAGPPGSGRTRVLEEAASQARERGFVVMTAHGGAPNQPWGALGDFARQMLARLPADHPLRGERGVRVLVGDAPSPAADPASPGRSDGASAALADLLTAAFSDRRGLLLLDDADALSSHALQAWRSLVRQISAASGPPQSPRALVVTSSSQRLRYERDAAVETIELGDLGRRHVVSLLAAVLTEPGKAALLADEILAVSGGRPGDIAAHLREMLERRALLQVGHRFHLADPGQQVLPAAGADRLRRAIQGAGREGAALAEAVAVAGRLRLTRDALGDLAELSGPRLQAAAESAVAAGLLCRDGAAWRVRTGSFRVRIEAMLPDERRRSLHHEILARLLDAAEPDWPAIAHHGRACGDSRAAEWTRTAFAQLRAAGRYDEAATHLDDARTSLDPSALDIELRLLHVETLLHAGRLDDATRSAAEIARDPRATPPERGRALLALAQLHRYDQAWTKVLAVELPEECGDPLVLARIRLLRATAHIFRGRYDLADREERLALAEVPDGEGALAASYFLLEPKSNRQLALRLSNDARQTLMQRLRHSCARHYPFEFILDLCRLGNVLRYAGDSKLSREVLRHAERLATRRLGANPLVRAWVNHTRCLLARTDHRPQVETRLLELTTLYASRSGTRTLLLNKSIELAASHCAAGTSHRASYSLIRNIAADLARVEEDVIIGSATKLAGTFCYYGLVVAVQQLQERVRGLKLSEATQLLVESWSAAASLMHDGDSSISAGTVADVHRELHFKAERLMKSICPGASIEKYEPLTIPELVATIAHLVRKGHVASPDWPDEWRPDQLVQLVRGHLRSVLPTRDLLYSLLMQSPASIGAENYEALAAVANEDVGIVPTATEWKRAAASARRMGAIGRLGTAMRLTAVAERLLCVLDRPESGDARAPSQAAGTACILYAGIRPHRASQAGVALRTERSRLPPRVDFPTTAWRSCLLRTLTTRRCVVWAFRGGDLAYFLQVVGQARPAIAWRPECNQIDCESTVLVPDAAALTPTQIESLLRDLQSLASACGGAVIGLSGGVSRGPCETIARRLLEYCGGAYIELPDPTRSIESRQQVIQSALEREGGGNFVLGSGTLLALSSYGWPGGIGEIVCVMRELIARGSETITLDHLADIGWSARTTRWGNGGETEVMERLLGQMADGVSRSSSELARIVRVPGRTTQRALSRLVAAEAVRREGHGRATRYLRPRE